MGLGELELVRDGAGSALHEGDLAGGVDTGPVGLEAARAGGIVDGGVNQLGGDAAGRGGVVVEQGQDVDVGAVRARQLDLAGLLESVVEVLFFWLFVCLEALFIMVCLSESQRISHLLVSVHLLVEPSLRALHDVVAGGGVTRQTKSTVSTIVARNLVQVPQVVLQLLGGDVRLDLVLRQRVVGKATERKERRGEKGRSLHFFFDGVVLAPRK